MEDNMDRDWRFTVNLSGVAAPTGRKALEVPEGYYKVVVSDAYVNPERNKDRVIFKLTISEGAYTGSIRTTGMNRPTGEDDNVRFYWRGIAESTGYTATELDAGAIELAPATFISREAYIHFVPKSEGNQWEKVDFLSPVEWTQQAQPLSCVRQQCLLDRQVQFWAAMERGSPFQAPRLKAMFFPSWESANIITLDTLTELVFFD
jgi:hypothetical protein